MAFPKEKTKTSNELAKSKLKGLQPKKSGEVSLFFCEFFEGMEVLQIQGKETGEFIFGLYFSGKLTGHCYFGEMFTPEEVLERVQVLFPPNFNELQKYVDQNDGVICYHHFAPSQYAWIYERILEKKIKIKN